MCTFPAFIPGSSPSKEELLAMLAYTLYELQALQRRLGQVPIQGARRFAPLNIEAGRMLGPLVWKEHDDIFFKIES